MKAQFINGMLYTEEMNKWRVNQNDVIDTPKKEKVFIKVS